MGLFKKDSAVGIEFDDFDARIVEISTGANPKLLKWGTIPIPQGAILDGNISEPGRVRDVLEKLWAISGIKNKTALLGISNPDVIIRYATFQKVEPTKLLGLIKFQAQEYLPIPLETVDIDYLIIDEYMENEIEMVGTLLVAAKKTMTESYVEVLEMAKVEISDIDVSTLALARLVADEDKEIAVANVNIYAGMVGVMLISENRPAFARIIPSSKRVEDDLKEWAEDLAEEVFSSIEFYHSKKGSKPIEKICVSGRHELINEFMEALSEKSELPITKLDLSGKINLGSATENKENPFIVSDYAVCISLALRGLEE